MRGVQRLRKRPNGRGSRLRAVPQSFHVGTLPGGGSSRTLFLVVKPIAPAVWSHWPDMPCGMHEGKIEVGSSGISRYLERYVHSARSKFGGPYRKHRWDARICPVNVPQLREPPRWSWMASTEGAYLALRAAGRRARAVDDVPFAGFHDRF